MLALKNDVGWAIWSIETYYSLYNTAYVKAKQGRTPNSTRIPTISFQKAIKVNLLIIWKYEVDLEGVWKETCLWRNWHLMSNDQGNESWLLWQWWLLKCYTTTNLKSSAVSSHYIRSALPLVQIRVFSWALIVSGAIWFWHFCHFNKKHLKNLQIFNLPSKNGYSKTYQIAVIWVNIQLKQINTYCTSMTYYQGMIYSFWIKGGLLFRPMEIIHDW